MDSKKKLFIIISAFLVVVLAVVAIVIAVLAAQNTTIKSSVNVKYSAEIEGTVTAAYKTETGDEVSMGSILYDGTELDGDEQTLDGMDEEVKLSKDNNYIDFIFTFTNTSGSAYKATVTLPTSTKFDIDYDAPEDFDESALFFIVPETAVDESTAVRFVVRYTIQSGASSASITGNFEWVLAYMD